MTTCCFSWHLFQIFGTSLRMTPAQPKTRELAARVSSLELAIVDEAVAKGPLNRNTWLALMLMSAAHAALFEHDRRVIAPKTTVRIQEPDRELEHMLKTQVSEHAHKLVNRAAAVTAAANVSALIRYTALSAAMSGLEEGRAAVLTQLLAAEEAGTRFALGGEFTIRLG